MGYKEEVKSQVGGPVVHVQINKYKSFIYMFI